MGDRDSGTSCYVAGLCGRGAGERTTRRRVAAYNVAPYAGAQHHKADTVSLLVSTVPIFFAIFAHFSLSLSLATGALFLIPSLAMALTSSVFDEASQWSSIAGGGLAVLGVAVMSSRHHVPCTVQRSR